MNDGSKHIVFESLAVFRMIPRYNLARYECCQAWNEHQHSGTGILSVPIQGSLTEGQLSFHPGSTPDLLTKSTPTFILHQDKEV